MVIWHIIEVVSRGGFEVYGSQSGLKVRSGCGTRESQYPSGSVEATCYSRCVGKAESVPTHKVLGEAHHNGVKVVCISVGYSSSFCYEQGSIIDEFGALLGSIRAVGKRIALKGDNRGCPLDKEEEAKEAT